MKITDIKGNIMRVNNLKDSFIQSRDAIVFLNNIKQYPETLHNWKHLLLELSVLNEIIEYSDFLLIETKETLMEFCERWGLEYETKNYATNTIYSYSKFYIKKTSIGYYVVTDTMSPFFLKLEDARNFMFTHLLEFINEN